MNKQDMKARIDKIQADIDQRYKDMAADDDVWPKNGDRYFFLYSDGDKGDYEFDGDEYDAEYFAIGNAFRTADERDAHIEYLKVCAELRGTDGRTVYSNGDAAYGIAFNADENPIPTVASYFRNLFFAFNCFWSTSEHAESALAKVGSDRISAAYLHEMRLGMKGK